MPEALQEPFTLTKGDAAVTSADGLIAAVAIIYSDIYTYLVPVGIGHIILPGHTLGMWLEGTDDAEMPLTTQLKLTLMDASGQDRKAIAGPFLYAQVRNLTDRDQMFRLNVPEPVKVYERQSIIIEELGPDATGTGGVDQTGASRDSIFLLSMSRVRQPL